MLATLPRFLEGLAMFELLFPRPTTSLDRYRMRANQFHSPILRWALWVFFITALMAFLRLPGMALAEVSLQDLYLESSEQPSSSGRANVELVSLSTLEALEVG